MKSSAPVWCRRAVVLVLFGIGIQAATERAFAQGPVATFAFGEGSGTTTADATGNGNTGTLGNGPTWTTGYYGGGISFDGVNDQIEIPMSTSLATMNAAFTLEAWINPTDSNQRMIVNRRDGNLLFYLTGNRQLIVQALLSGSWKTATSPAGTIPLNAWSHVAATYDGAFLTVYINAVAKGTVTATGSLPSTTNAFRIGSPNNIFAGTIDDVRFYARALNVAEIRVDQLTPIDSATSFQVAAVTPLNEAVGVLSTPVTVGFSRPLSSGTLDATTFTLVDSTNVAVAATVSYDATTRTATLAPSNALQPSITYTARIAGGMGGVSDINGNTLPADVTWAFQTASGPTAAVASYAFSEGSGTTTADGSGNGNVASFVNSATWTSGGYFGNALTFNGSNSYLEIPMSESLAAMSSSFTFEAWINPADLNQRMIVDRRDNNVNFYAGGNGQLTFGASIGGAWKQISSVAGTVAANTWSHVAATYDGSTVRLYVNALQVASMAATGSLAALTNSYLIGAPNNVFSGRIDEVRFYRSPLAATDLALDMNTGVDHATAFIVAAKTPANGAVGILTTPVTAGFSHAANASTLNGSSFILLDGTNSAVSASVTYDASTHTATLAPTNALTPFTTYTVKVVGGASGVLDANGSALAADVTWTFRTASASTVAVASYAFSEGNGTTASDGAGNGNTAAFVNSPAWTTGGYFGNALTFNGSNSYLEIPMSESLVAMASSFTFEAWINPADVNQRMIVDRRDNNVNFYAGGNGQLTFGASIGGAWKQITSVAGTLPANSWSHVAATYDGGTVRLYINASQVASVAATGSLAALTNSYLIGAPNNVFSGRIDEVRFYRSALTATDLALDMNSPVDPTQPFSVAATTPANGALGVTGATFPTIGFSRPVDATTLTTANIQLLDNANHVLPGLGVSYNPTTRTATLMHTSQFGSLANYTVRIVGGAGGVKDANGNALAADVVWTFRSAASGLQAAAAYSFSEGTGTTTADSSGNGNTATFVNGPTWSTGYFGGALTFNGSNSYLEIPASPTLAAIASSFTFEAWVNPADLNQRMIVDRRDNNVNFYVGGNAQLTFGGLIGGVWKQITSASGSVASNAWSHVAATYDGSTIRLYVNASQVASLAATGTLAALTNSYLIGAPNNVFSGRIDEVRFYRTALASTDLAVDMSTPVDPQQSVITSLNPTAGPVGQSVTLTGVNFGSSQGATTVTFNGAVASTTSWSNTSIMAIVPAGATSGSVVVTKQGVSSNAVPFSVLPTPAIASLSPTIGAAGQSVTISGTNFGVTQGSSTVTFNGVAANAIGSWSSTSIVATIPAGATTGSVVVTVTGVPSNGVTFIVDPPAVISSLNPNAGSPGQAVTIAGTNFGATQGSTSLTFNGTSASASSWSDTSIVATVPSGGTTGPVVITKHGAASNQVNFTIISAPVIASISPNSGPIGQSVTISGFNFGSSQGASTVTFNGAAASITSWSATGVVAVVPPSSTGPVIVTVNGQASNAVMFTSCSYFVSPSATMTVPASGQTGYLAVTTTGPYCTAWTPASNDEWLTFGAPIFDQWGGYNARILADAPLAYWAFSDGVGNTVTQDWTGHDLTGALSGGARVDSNGTLTFDGTGSMIVAPSSLLTLTNAFSVELWLQTSPGTQRVIGAANDPWELYVTSSGLLELRMLGHVLQSIHAFPNDQQQHLVDVTWDGAAAVIYVDGALDAQQAISGTLASSANGLLLGAHPTRGDYFTGTMSGLVLFDRGLSAATIADRWLWLNGNQSATSGVVSFSAAANLTGGVRATTVSVGGSAIAMTQAGQPSPVSSDVVIVTPFNGTIFNGPSVIDVSVTVNDPAGSVTRVDVYANDALIGSAANSPYIVAWQAPADGQYVLKAVAADDAGLNLDSVPVQVGVTHGGSGLGTLGAPIASPHGGPYTTPPTVFLTADPSAVIRYTTDGSDATASSPVYAGPIAVANTTTIHARAFESGWTTSPMLVETYVVEPIDSTIVSMPLLQYRVTDTDPAVNYTSWPTLDWVHWGRVSAAVPDRMAGTTPRIGNLLAINGGVPTVDDHSFVQYSWSDGDRLSVTAAPITTGASVSGANGKGFRLFVPADTAVKTLRLRIAAVNAAVTFAAYLSDGASSGPDSSIFTFDRLEKTLSFDFGATSPDQFLTVDVIQTHDYGAEVSGPPGQLVVEGASLELAAPQVAIGAPIDGATFTAPASVSVTSSSTTIGAELTDVEALVNGSFVAELSPGLNVSTTLPPLGPGHYQLAIRGTDDWNVSSTSRPIEVDVIGSGGALTLASRAAAPTSVNLSTEGTADWTLFAESNPRYDRLPLDRTGGLFFGRVANAGNHRPYVVTDASASFTYSDGFGISGGQSSTALRVAERAQGFVFTVKADQAVRTLRVYVGAEHARAHFQAFLSDGSGPVIDDAGFDQPGGANDAMYVVNYQAASPGQTLTVRYTLDLDYGHGAIWLDAATVEGASGAVVSDLWPRECGPGCEVTLMGSGFGNSQGASTVSVGGINATISSWSDWRITFVVPGGVSSGAVTVAVGGVSTVVPVDPNIRAGFLLQLGMRPTPQNAYISPDETSVPAGGTVSLNLVDAIGQPVTGATWTVDQPTRAHLTAQPSTNEVAVEGLTTGDVVISATGTFGTAKATVHVGATGDSLAAGATKWQVFPDTANDWFYATVQAHPQQTGDPALFLSDGYSVRALTEDGRLLWRTFVDAWDGVIATSDGGALASSGTVTKLSRSGSVVWTAPISNISAVAPDGTIYSGLSVYDGATGALNYSLQGALPHSTRTMRGNAASNNFFRDDSCLPYESSSPPPPTDMGVAWLSGRVVAGDGHYYVAYAVVQETLVSDTTCGGTYAGFFAGSYNNVTDVYVQALTPTGAGAAELVAHNEDTVGQNRSDVYSIDRSIYVTCYQAETACPLQPPDGQAIPQTTVENVAPDGAGGIFVRRVVQGHLINDTQDRLARFGNAGSNYDVPNPDDGFSAVQSFAIADDRFSFVLHPNRVMKIDPATADVLWQRDDDADGNGADFLAATDDGGALTYTVNWSTNAPVATIKQLDKDGVEQTRTTVYTDLSSYPPVFMFPGGLGLQSPNSSAVRVIAIPEITAGIGSVFPLATGTFAPSTGGWDLANAVQEKPFRLTINTFIPEEWVDSPPNPFTTDLAANFGFNRIFEGDNRKLGQPGSSRLSYFIEVLTRNGVPVAGRSDFSVGLTEEYEKSTALDGDHLTGRARNDWQWGAPLKTRWKRAQKSPGVATCTTTSILLNTINLSCQGGASNPLVHAAPGTQYDLQMSLSFTPASVHYHIYGCHKSFPAYEVIGNRQLLLGDIDSGNPITLSLPCSTRTVDVSGDAAR